VSKGVAKLLPQAACGLEQDSAKSTAAHFRLQLRYGISSICPNQEAPLVYSAIALNGASH